MKNRKTKQRLRSILTWVLWVILIQFVLINISAALYAHKLTHLRTATADTWEPKERDIFTKTWRLFTGPTFYKQPLVDSPRFTYSTLQLTTSGDIPIEAWYSRPDSASKGTVIMLHGITSNKGELLDEATAFLEQHYSVLLVDLRNHGGSGGKSTSIGYREAEEVRLAYEHVSSMGEKNIILWGASLGAVVILKAVAESALQPSAIILEMPFVSLQAHLEGRARTLGFPEQPFGFLTTFWIGLEKGFNGLGFNVIKYAKKIHCPVLVQYGEKDELVLKKEIDAIYSAIPVSNKKLTLYEHLGHQSILRADPATWKNVVFGFLSGIALPTSGL